MRRWEGAARTARAQVTVALLVLACALLATSVGMFPSAGAWASEAAGVSGTTSGGEAPGGVTPLPAGLDPSSAHRTTIARLALADGSLDNSLVTFRGEAVGEAVASSSPGYRWVLLQSNASGSTSSVEVLMTNEQVAQIASFGSYKVKGATLEVTGIYRVADPNQTGTLDVTAYAVRVVDEGGAVGEEVATVGLWAGGALAAAGLGVSGAIWYRRRRSRS